MKTKEIDDWETLQSPVGNAHDLLDTYDLWLTQGSHMEGL